MNMSKCNNKKFNCRDENKESINYKIDKTTFIVTPVFRETGENIFAKLIKLIREDTKKS